MTILDTFKTLVAVRSLRPFLAVWIMLCSNPALSFGADGHRIVVNIAENHISPKTASAIGAIIGDADLDLLSLWPDKIRHLPAWKQSKYWHYINIDDREPFNNLKRNSDGDVLSALEHFYAELQDPQLGNKQKIEALAFFMHFVADIHQPLHVGRRDDRGGNSIEVQWLHQPTRANLHQVWDSLILKQENKTPLEYSQRLDRAHAGQITRWQQSHFLQWAKESKALRNQVYNFSPEIQRKRTTISPAYIERNKPIIEQRLLMAGIRLAGYLNRIFDPSGQ